MKPGVPPPTLPPSSRNSRKVVWSPTEKTKVISRAVDVQSERPDLAGLPLLREAMLVLPPSRRRRIIAVTQAPWFEEGVAREIKRRVAEVNATVDMVPLLRQTAIANSTVAERQGFTLEINKEWKANHEAWRASHEAWRVEEQEQLGEIIGLLNSILTELRKLTNGNHPSRAHAGARTRA